MESDGELKALVAANQRPLTSVAGRGGMLEPLDAAARHDLLEILEERYGRLRRLLPPRSP